jgi:hypothetical protein
MDAGVNGASIIDEIGRGMAFVDAGERPGAI